MAGAAGGATLAGERSTARRATWLAGLLIGLVALIAGCGPAPVAGAPQLRDLRLDGQAPRNAMVLLFSVQFEDLEGDLGEGSLTPFVNDRDTGEAPLPLADLLLASGLEPDATAGELAFNLEVEMSLDPAHRPEPGSTFKVGVEFTDEAGHVSNRPTVTLRIDYP